jgi:hypothetical protein
MFKFLKKQTSTEEKELSPLFNKDGEFNLNKD